MVGVIGGFPSLLPLAGDGGATRRMRVVEQQGPWRVPVANPTALTPTLSREERERGVLASNIRRRHGIGRVEGRAEPLLLDFGHAPVALDLEYGLIHGV